MCPFSGLKWVGFDAYSHALFMHACSFAYACIKCAFYAHENVHKTHLFQPQIWSIFRACVAVYACIKCAFYAPENVHKTHLFQPQIRSRFRACVAGVGGQSSEICFFFHFWAPPDRPHRPIENTAPRACVTPKEDKMCCVLCAVCCVLCAVCCVCDEGGGMTGG